MSITMVSLKPVQAFLNFWIGSAAHCEVFTFLWRLVQVCDSCTRATMPQYVRLCSSDLPARKQMFCLAHAGTSTAVIYKEFNFRSNLVSMFRYLDYQLFHPYKHRTHIEHRTHVEQLKPCCACHNTGLILARRAGGGTGALRLNVGVNACLAAPPAPLPGGRVPLSATSLLAQLGVPGGWPRLRVPRPVRSSPLLRHPF